MQFIKKKGISVGIFKGTFSNSKMSFQNMTARCLANTKKCVTISHNIKNTTVINQNLKLHLNHRQLNLI